MVALTVETLPVESVRYQGYIEVLRGPGVGVADGRAADVAVGEAVAVGTAVSVDVGTEVGVFVGTAVAVRVGVDVALQRPPLHDAGAAWSAEGTLYAAASTTTSTGTSGLKPLIPPPLRPAPCVESKRWARYVCHGTGEHRDCH
jgi:hypothetical protein